MTWKVSHRVCDAPEWHRRYRWFLCCYYCLVIGASYCIMQHERKQFGTQLEHLTRASEVGELMEVDPENWL